MRPIVTLVTVLALCAPLDAFGSSSSPPLSAKAQLAAMESAANSRHSLHYVSVSSATGYKLRVVADVGPKAGIQRITFTDHGQSGAATVMVKDRTVYLRGDDVALKVYFGFTPPAAVKYAGKWISVPKSHPGYLTLSNDATFPSFVSQLFPKHAKLSLVTPGNLIGVRGEAHGQAGVTVTTTVLAPAQGKPLPVKEIVRSSKSDTGVVWMSKWNEVVRVSKPAHSVPITKVAAS
jgi:hypothetical protein